MLPTSIMRTEREEEAHLHKWMMSERFSEIRRPYTARDIVNFRDVVPRHYPSEVQVFTNLTSLV